MKIKFLLAIILNVNLVCAFDGYDLGGIIDPFAEFDVHDLAEALAREAIEEIRPIGGRIISPEEARRRASIKLEAGRRRLVAEQKKALAAQKKIEEDARRARFQRELKVLRAKEAEQKKALAEEKRLAKEQKKAWDEKRKIEEEARIARSQRELKALRAKEAEQKKALAEEKRLAKEQKKLSPKRPRDNGADGGPATKK